MRCLSADGSTCPCVHYNDMHLFLQIMCLQVVHVHGGEERESEVLACSSQEERSELQRGRGDVGLHLSLILCSRWSVVQMWWDVS